MEEKIQIKCPFDGALLSVTYKPGIETKTLTCPICKHKYPFTQFKRVTPGPQTSAEDPGTDYPGSHEEEHTSYGHHPGKEETEVGTANYTLGKVKIPATGVSYQLRPGRNVIGRKGAKSTADFQIDTADKRSMSREHLVIEAKKVPGHGYMHYVSLFKEKVNKTYVGNEPLLFGDCLVLNHGDELRLPDATLKFEIPDEEGTEI